MARAIAQTVATVLLLAASLFGSAGALGWPMAWAFLASFVASALVAFLVVDPSLLRERSKLLRGAQGADSVLAPAFALLLYPGEMIICGLDRRYGWSPMLPFALQVMALGVFVAGYAFALWAMRVNAFFATAVKVQPERGHRVVDAGPYGWVRHPGYAGTVVAHLVLPIALGSLWGIVPAVAGSVLLGVRAVYEERLLKRELVGYADYTGRVPWRFVPLVW